MIEFNINQGVKVKLTDVGRAALKAKHDALYHPSKVHSPVKYRPRKEDADGWSEWQLWELMGELGDKCYMGGRVPFETTIIIKTGD